MDLQTESLGGMAGQHNFLDCNASAVRSVISSAACMILTGISLSRMDKEMYFISEYQEEWDKRNFIGKPSMRKRPWHSLPQDLAQTKTALEQTLWNITFTLWWLFFDICEVKQWFQLVTIYREVHITNLELNLRYWSQFKTGNMVKSEIH